MMHAHENPFATNRVETLLSFHPEWASLSWDKLDHNWSNAHYKGSITGRHGAGKTTLISEWEKRLVNRGENVLRLFLNQESKTFTPQQWSDLTSEKITTHIVILDGEEQLSYLHRRKFYALTQKAKGLIVTRHRQNQLTNLVHLDPSIEMLHQCVREIAPEHYHTLEPFFQSWWKEKKGNIREILLACYDAL